MNTLGKTCLKLGLNHFRISYFWLRVCKLTLGQLSNPYEVICKGNPIGVTKSVVVSGLKVTGPPINMSGNFPANVSAI